MSSRHPRPWHRGSEFGAGPRAPLCRERRAQWRARLDLHRRAGRVTALHAEVGRALLRRLAEDGQCDPAHDTIAADAGCGVRTVGRALAALRRCGLVTWTRRLVRAGWRAAQTSSAYVLQLGDLVPIPVRRCDGQVGRETRNRDSISAPDPQAIRAAQAALAAIREARGKKVAQESAARWTRGQPAK
jgi:hypothetical protein